MPYREIEIDRDTLYREALAQTFRIPSEYPSRRPLAQTFRIAENRP